MQEENRLKPHDQKLDLVAVTSPDLSQIFEQLDKNEGIDIAVLCNYPVQNGIHTHWLAARQLDGNKLLIVGDLKPFGIRAVGISVPINDVLEAMGRVIGATPTTNLTQVLAESSGKDRGLLNAKMFLVNFVRRRF